MFSDKECKKTNQCDAEEPTIKDCFVRLERVPLTIENPTEPSERFNFEIELDASHMLMLESLSQSSLLDLGPEVVEAMSATGFAEGSRFNPIVLNDETPPAPPIAEETPVQRIVFELYIPKRII